MMEKGYVSLSIPFPEFIMENRQGWLWGWGWILGKGSSCVGLGRWLCAPETEARLKHSFYFILLANEGQTVTSFRKEVSNYRRQLLRILWRGDARGLMSSVPLLISSK